VDPGNIHITLAFLGDTEVERIKDLGMMLEEVCKGFGQFTFNLVGTGLFKNYRDPRVIWIGIDDAKELLKLNNDVIKGLSRSGFIIENKPFRPHLTIGRVKSINNRDQLQTNMERYHEIKFQTVTVNEIILFESILRPSGPQYIPIQYFSLLL
jgi:2'-5' RNA ligase